MDTYFLVDGLFKLEMNSIRLLLVNNLKAWNTLKLLHPMYKSFRGRGWHFSEMPVKLACGMSLR